MLTLTRAIFQTKPLYSTFNLGKIIPIILLVVLGIAVLGSIPAYAAGNTYYVAKNGSNSNLGSEGSPWLTIQYAVGRMAAGDSVLVRAGTYNELVSVTSRPANLTLKAYPGEMPVISGAGIATGVDQGIVTIRNTDYFRLEGFEITNTPASTGSYGVFVHRDVDHLTLKNLKVHNINKGGLYFCGIYDQNSVTSSTGTVTNLVVDGCEVYDTNRIVASNEQVSLLRVNGFEIKNSKFHDSGINGINTDGKDGIDFKQGTRNGSIHNCEIYGSNYIYGDASSGTSWNGIYIDGQGNAQDNIKIYNNYFHDISQGAIVLGNEVNSAAQTNIDIYNNIFYNNQYALRIYPHNFTKNYRFINNTCYKNYYTIVSQATSGVNSNCIIRNNILYGTYSDDYLIYIANYTSTGKPAIDHNICYNSSGKYQSHLAAITGGYIAKDPLFISAPGNLRLQSNSPAIDAGSSSNAPAEDKDGNSRPMGNDYDIGAYESSASSANHAPVLSPIGDKNVDEGTSLSFSISAADADGDAITYSGSSLPSGASFNSSTRTFSWTPGAAQSGTYSGVRFSASDGSLTDSETITITVNDTIVVVNHAPVLSPIGDKNVDEGTSLSFSISAADADGDAITYSGSSLPSGASFNGSTRTFSWTPGAAQSGTYSGVRFSASDGSLTDSETITITVNDTMVAPNRPPVLASIGSKKVNEGASLSFTISATDPDGDALTYSAASLPSGASFNSSTRTFSWKPGYSQAGTYSNIRFSVSDGKATDYENILITVSHINQAPVLAAIGDKAVSEGALLSFAITATDPDGDALTYSAANLPSGASFNAATRTFSWRPRSSQAGLFAGVHFQVSDGRLTDQEDIAVTVKAVQNDDNRKTSGSGGGGGGGGGSDNPTTLDIQTEGLASTPAVQISPDGMVTGYYELQTNDGTLTLNISDGSKLLTKEKNAVSLLSAEVLSSTPATPSGEALIIAFRLGPDGATVDPSLTISFSYEPAKLPTGVAGEDLFIAFYDGLQWRTLESSVDQQANTVSAQITHFSHYALLGRVTPPLVPVILPAEPALTTPSDSPLNTPTPEIGSQFASLNIDQNLQAASRIAPDKGVVPAPASLPVSGEVIKIEENVQPASLAPYQDISRTPGIMPDTRMEAPILSSPLPEETAAPGEQTQIAYLASVETALVNPLPDPYESATPTEEVSKAEKSQGGPFRWPFLLAIVAVIAAMILVIEVVMGVSLLIIRRRNGINPQ